MAIQKINESFLYARNAGANLSSAMHLLATVDTDGDIILAGANSTVLGTIYEAAPENHPVTVQFGGIGKVKLGTGGCTPGQLLAAAANGLAVVAAGAGKNVVGIAIEGGAEGAVVAFVFQPNKLTA